MADPDCVHMDKVVRAEDVDRVHMYVTLWSNGEITIPADALHVGDRVILRVENGEFHAEVKHLSCMTPQATP